MCSADSDKPSACGLPSNADYDAASGEFAYALTDSQWREKLSAQAYNVLREQGTQRAFTGQYWNSHANGTYHCAGCGMALFASTDKFSSGSGWPSFKREMQQGGVAESPDTSHGMTRVEVHCSNCGGHLGHVFEDGPAPTGLRYCINDVALEFEPAQE